MEHSNWRKIRRFRVLCVLSGRQDQTSSIEKTPKNKGGALAFAAADVARWRIGRFMYFPFRG
jgi:hypothetical protein